MTPTDALREQVRSKMGGHLCPACAKWHMDDAMALRDATAQSGVPASVLSRFLNGQPINSNTWDALHEWLNR